MKAPAKSRLDQALTERELCPSRAQAQRWIRAGQVRLNGQIADKPGRLVSARDQIDVIATDRFVSRGGWKLQHALQQFQISVDGLTAVDLGASTGGFTDCLLQHGAARVCAVDVGRGQLAWKLRVDPRVIVLEGTNARSLRPEQIPPGILPAGLVVVDCSFISLRLVLPSAVALLAPNGKIISLIKPQFEAGKAEADRGQGVITDPRVHERVLRELEEFVEQLGSLRWRSVTESPLRGPAGNKEFLVLLENIA